MTTTYSGIDNFPPAMALVDDGVPPTAAQMNPFFQGAADRTTWLYNRVSKIYLQGQDQYSVPDTGPAALNSFVKWQSSSIVTNAWIDPGVGNSQYTTSLPINAGDILDIEAIGNLDVNLVAGYQAFTIAIEASFAYASSTYSYPVSPSQAFRVSYDGTTGNERVVPLRIKSRIVVPSGSNPTSLTISLKAYVPSTFGSGSLYVIPNQISVSGDFQYLITQYRLTGK